MSRSGRFDLRHILQTKVLDRLLADLELLDLAGHRCREAWDELPVVRRLEVRQRRTAEVAQLLLGRRLPLPQLHPRKNFFPQTVTGKIQKFKIREQMIAELGLVEQETA